jgi:hypothetical protein
MAADKIRIGNGVKKTDDWIKASICLTDIPAEHIRIGKNGKKYLNIDINIYDKKNEYGQDVSIKVDTWKPETKSEVPKTEPEIPKPEDDSLPF